MVTVKWAAAVSVREVPWDAGWGLFLNAEVLTPHVPMVKIHPTEHV